MQHANSFGVLNSNYETYNSDTFRINRSMFSNMPSSSSISSQFSGHSSSCLADGYSGRATATLSTSTSRSSNMLASPTSSKPIVLPYKMAQPMPGTKIKHPVAKLLSKGVAVSCKFPVIRGVIKLIALSGN